MNLFSETNEFKLYHGSMLDLVNVIPVGSIDSIVTDPPYELNFMGKGWDNSGIAFKANTWRQCFNVLKPGGYLLAFGGSRTFHRIACAIEDAGFEIRDTIMWIYGSGFPKSMNIGKAVESKLVNGSANTQDWRKLKGTKVETGNWGLSTNAYEYGARPSDYTEDGHLRVDKVEYQTDEGKRWNGWGTCLKPAYEPIIVARKPCEGSCVDNILLHGVGGINIDECRIGDECIKTNGGDKFPNLYGKINAAEESTHNGRFPSNVILTYDETDQEEVCGGFPIGNANGSVSKTYGYSADVFGEYKKKDPFDSYGDSGSAARYFYCAKASKRDRNDGITDSNSHPTVKPVDLMQYLVRLVTPKGGTILDPFNGSGSTGKAVMYENKDRNAGYKYIGIELTEEYLPISDARIRYAIGDTAPADQTNMQNKTLGQISIFDLLE